MSSVIQAESADSAEIIGAIVCKQDVHKSNGRNRGYIAMLSVSKDWRKRGVGEPEVLSLCY